MTNNRKPKSTRPNRGRHEAECKICRHPQRDEIERAFVQWHSPARIAKEFAFRDRKSIYRHAHAFDLFPKRAANVRAALETIIERAGDVKANASAIVAAVAAYARINAAGKWVERSETVNLNELFDRMTTAELERYATSGLLPEWFPSSGTAGNGARKLTDA